jgi:hypothetical protein
MTLTPPSFPKVVPPHPVEGVDCLLLPYWSAVQQWRERDSSWPQSVYWHLFARQIQVSEAVLDKCYRNFTS